MRTVRDGQMKGGEEGGLTLINDPLSVCARVCDVRKCHAVLLWSTAPV